MVFKNLCVLVLWMKVASALEWCITILTHSGTSQCLLFSSPLEVEKTTPGLLIPVINLSAINLPRKVINLFFSQAFLSGT